MLGTLRAPVIAILGSLALAGCAGGNLLGQNTAGSTLATGSVSPKPAVDPTCVTLAAQIDKLNASGIDKKIDKAARRKYRLKRKDLRNVDALTKANADFRAKCSKLPILAAAPKVAAAASQVAKKANPTTAAGAQKASQVARTVVQAQQQSQ